jgi:hypothetical protein
MKASSMKQKVCLCVGIVSCLLAALSMAQEKPVPLDGPKVVFADPLLDKMVGNWKVGGTIRGRSVAQTVQAEWVLDHQFLRVHEKGTPDPKSAPAYEAIVMIGYDHASDRYVAHWMDNGGGRYSETLGYGLRSGDEIKFVFEYPDGPFHTTFLWLPERNQWQWLMQTKDNLGHWVEFANLTLTRAEPAH